MSKSSVYAGIDIGGTNIKYGLVDESGKVLYRDKRPTMVEKGADALMHLVTNIAEQLLYDAADEGYEVPWVGVGTPGAVDSKTGTVIGPCPNIAGWQGMAVGDVLHDRLNLPVFVDNDANAMALAEARFGAAIGHNIAICVTLGTGVGGGIVVANKLWRGANGSAGEIGHMTINFDGPDCAPSGTGCLEAYCCSRAIVGRARARLEKEMTPVMQDLLNGDYQNLTIKKIFAAARRKDPVAIAVIEETATYLGYGLAGAVNLLNPDIVVIGGGIADGGGSFIDAVTRVIRQRAFDSAVEDLRVTRAALGNQAGFIGAAILGAH